jgi:SAM-dependent methyltransferase
MQDLRTATYIWRFRLYGLRVRLGLAAPANQAISGLTESEIATQAQYALDTARSFHRQLAGRDVAGKALLELGPGANFGAVMTLAEMTGAGAVAVCDRFLTPWNADYHGRLYDRLADMLDTAGFPNNRLRRAARDGHQTTVATYAVGIEDIPAADRSVDLIVSQAVLEHLADYPAAFRQLHRITAPGGIGLHQVDFRDHRDFTRPLELALLSEPAYRRLFAASKGECGARLRPVEMARLLEAAGFEVEMHANDFATDTELARAFARLGAERKLTEDELRVIGAMFTLRLEPVE